VDRHGSETYFVIGEGLLGESRGGRELAIEAAPKAVEAAPPFRFSRLGPKGSAVQIGKPMRLKLAQAMTADNLSPGQIPAGFTYLGQFIDHDLTFDKSALMEGVSTSRPRRCCSLARQASISTPSTGTGLPIPAPRSSTRVTGSI
jgi:hypothetical protein